jgi:protein SCO1/2
MHGAIVIVMKRTISLLIALLLAACTPTFAPTPTTTPAPTFAPRAIRVEQPITPPDVPMLDQAGRPTRLSDLRGRLALVFFGNVDCESDCVDGRAIFQQVKQALGPRQDVAYVMVGTDDATDSPAALTQYLAEVDPTFIGLTAARADMRTLAMRFGIHTYVRPDGALAPHAPFTYLLDRDGRLIYFFQDGLGVSAIVDALQPLLDA